MLPAILIKHLQFCPMDYILQVVFGYINTRLVIFFKRKENYSVFMGNDVSAVRLFFIVFNFLLFKIR